MRGVPLKIVFFATVISMAFILGALIFMAVVGARGGPAAVEALKLGGFGTFVPTLGSIWLGGAGILWIYGFALLGRRWPERSAKRNALLLFTHLFFGIFLSPYFFWKRETL